MHGNDGGLHGVRAEAPGGERPLYQRGAFNNLRLIPAAAVLLVEAHQLARLIGTRGAAGVMQQHQGQQPHQLRIGQQLKQQTPETDSLGAEVGTGQLAAAGGGIAFIENQVDHPLHVIQPSRQLFVCGYSVGNARVANLLLGADDALGNGAG